ncbi:KH domain-containing protein [Meloidogyne graminicola]|uniref:KH domain-containing protein n=1 Tax=Meloidogyne graminicola TaxID=189291 RepID=A0A8T0A245_9BILA|nr:KH domain-containing protein [Meloidogyne graminicola]
MDYLAQLIHEKSTIAAFPNHFKHTDRLIDLEIARVRAKLFQCNFDDDLPKLPELESHEDIVTLQEKVYVPNKEHPEFNFVGRILGPRGMTAKQLEHETGCKIMVRGRGSLRDTKKEEANRGKPNWEHLEDNLHILIQCEDTEKRARSKLDKAVGRVKKLLVPTNNGIDELKRKQLMELSIINGTYRSAIGPKSPPSLYSSSHSAFYNVFSYAFAYFAATVRLTSDYSSFEQQQYFVLCNTLGHSVMSEEVMPITCNGFIFLQFTNSITCPLERKKVNCKRDDRAC